MERGRPSSGRVLVLAACSAALLAAAARGALPATVPAGRIESRLLGAAGSVSVWVEFRDKGESGPADLARRLAAAEAALVPRARARRLRARVSPLVDYLDLPVSAPYLEALRARGLAPYGVSRWLNRAAVRASGSELARLAELPFVARIEPVERAVPLRDEPGSLAPARRAHPAGAARTSIDYGSAGSQLAQIGVPALHDSGYTGAGVLVCVLDDGFNFWNVNPALARAASRVVATRDFVRGTGDPTDTTASLGQMRHGTETWSCMAGYAPGRYVGAAFDAGFALGRTEYDLSEHLVELVWWTMGAEWADSLGADILSSSLGYTTFDPPDSSFTIADLDGHTTPISRAAEIAASKGILVVNSAGNSGCADPRVCWYYVDAPADVNGDSLIAVGAIDADGIAASFSSHGPTADGRIKPDLVARGEGVEVVSAADTGYAISGGTSFSAPLVAGLAACMMQAQPGWPLPRPEEAWPASRIIRALRVTASQARRPDDTYGYGIPDGAAALAWSRDTTFGTALPVRVAARLYGPNPLSRGSGSATVLFGAGAGVSGPARVRILDVAGRVVRGDLPYGANLTGAHTELRWAADWDGRDGNGRLLRPGLYFIMVEAGGSSAAVRLVSLR